MPWRRGGGFSHTTSSHETDKMLGDQLPPSLTHNTPQKTKNVKLSMASSNSLQQDTGKLELQRQACGYFYFPGSLATDSMNNKSVAISEPFHGRDLFLGFIRNDECYVLSHWWLLSFLTQTKQNKSCKSPSLTHHVSQHTMTALFKLEGIFQIFCMHIVCPSKSCLNWIII